MRFAHPEILWLLLALPVLAAAAWISASRKRRALRRFAGGADTLQRVTGDISSHRRVAKALLLQLALLASLLAAARPQWGTLVDEVQVQGGIESKPEQFKIFVNTVNTQFHCQLVEVHIAGSINSFLQIDSTMTTQTAFRPVPIPVQTLIVRQLEPTGIFNGKVRIGYAGHQPGQCKQWFYGGSGLILTLDGPVKQWYVD